MKTNPADTISCPICRRLVQAELEIQQIQVELLEELSRRKG